VSLAGGLFIPNSGFSVVLLNAFAFLKGPTYRILGNHIASSCGIEFFLKSLACGRGNLVIKTNHQTCRKARRCKGQSGADKNIS
jgi:hypothetical protein